MAVIKLLINGRGQRDKTVAGSDAIPMRRRFTTSTGNLRSDYDWLGRGYLPKEWTETLPEPEYFTRRRNYYVYSYATPIAWWDGMKEEWVVPNEKYSMTTSAHQRQVRMALLRAGLTYRESV